MLDHQFFHNISELRLFVAQMVGKDNIINIETRENGYKLWYFKRS